jgi:putative alpha-1,2-mannosidase
LYEGQTSDTGALISAYAKFDPKLTTVNVRVGVSFISVDQARKNLENEIPDGVTLEETARKTRQEWSEKLDRIKIREASEEQKEIFYTAFFHTLQVRLTILLFKKEIRSDICASVSV